MIKTIFQAGAHDPSPVCTNGWKKNFPSPFSILIFLSCFKQLPRIHGQVGPVNREYIFLFTQTSANDISDDTTGQRSRIHRLCKKHENRKTARANPSNNPLLGQNPLYRQGRTEVPLMWLLLPAEATAVLFSASSLSFVFFSVNTITHDDEILQEHVM